MAINNKPASDYAKPHTMSGSTDIDLGVSVDKDPNTLRADEVNPSTVAMTVSIGNKVRGPKTDGIETRGNGAATKGRIARGPMA
jgi:hypothetical protein